MPNDLLTAPPPNDTGHIGQALLFSPGIERLEIEEARGIYTLERVKVQRPELIPAIIEGTVQGEGQLSLAAKLNCHHRTISLVQRHPDYAEAIDIARAKIVARLRSAAGKLVELIDNDPQSVPPNMRALAVGQLLDKAELLDGRAQHRTEHISRLEIHGSWNQWLVENLPSESEKQLGSEDVREILPVIGLHGGENLPLGALVRPTAAEVIGDAESLDPSRTAEANDESATGPDTDSVGFAGHPPPSEEGGGGGAFLPGGAKDQMRPGPPKFSGNGSSAVEESV